MTQGPNHTDSYLPVFAETASQVLFNHGNLDFHVSKGDRTAQFLLERIASPAVVAVESLPETIRGVQGFDSSGLNTLSENADISSAAAADLSVESPNILDRIEGTVGPM